MLTKMQKKKTFRKGAARLRQKRNVPLGRSSRFIALGLVCGDDSSLLLAMVACLLVACLVDGRSLRDALVVAAPLDNSAFGQVQDALYGFPALQLAQIHF